MTPKIKKAAMTTTTTKIRIIVKAAEKINK